MGPHPHIRWLQLGRPSLLRNLFCLVPCFISKASQVRDTVSRLPRLVPLRPSTTPFTKLPQWHVTGLCTL